MSTICGGLSTKFSKTAKKKKKKKSFPHIFHLKTKTNTQHTNREQNFSMEGE